MSKEDEKVEETKNVMHFEIEDRPDTTDTRGCTVCIKGYLTDGEVVDKDSGPICVEETTCSEFLWDFMNAVIFNIFETTDIQKFSMAERGVTAIRQSRGKVSPLELAIAFVRIEVDASGHYKSFNPAPIISNPLAYHEARDQYHYYSQEVRKPVNAHPILSAMVDYLSGKTMCGDMSQCQRSNSCPLAKLKMLIEYILSNHNLPDRDKLHELLEDMSPKTVWEGN